MSTAWKIAALAGLCTLLGWFSCFIVFVLLTVTAVDPPPVPTTVPVEKIVYVRVVDDPIGDTYPIARGVLYLLIDHESVNGTQMEGDGGLAQGWLHQHESNWNEGCDELGVDWKWPEATRDREKCEHVAMANWLRYAKRYVEEGNVEELIRRFRKPGDPYAMDNYEYVDKVLGR